MRSLRQLQAEADAGRYDAAIGGLEALLAAQGDDAPALELLAGILRDCGQLERARSAYLRALEFKPESSHAASALLFLEHYRGHDRQALFERHLAWAKRFAFAPARQAAHANDRNPDRPLRIGYVSADFNSSSAAFFIEPVLAHHCASEYTVYCYDAGRRQDAATRRLRSRAGQWREIAALDDEDLCVRVRADGIDILVDLNGHSRGHRLTAFARKPAPLQVTYLGYGATTGLSAMDYRLTDGQLDPPGGAERYYVERLVRLPGSMWCFAPPQAAPLPGRLPAAANGYVTFGSLNNFSKVSDKVIALWASILASLPGSRLVMFGVPGGRARTRTAALFAGAGVEATRLVFFDRMPLETYLRIHQSLDIALDPFPYTGGATTCNALWMGVPTLTLAGDGPLARSGLSILGAAGLDDWVAHSEGQYLSKACGHALGLDRLAALRAGLRARVKASPLCDGKTFVGNLERAYRNMWRNWCRGEDNGD